MQTEHNSFSDKLLSIVSPCYNEEGNILAFVEACHSVLLDYKLEIILVDDGSKDRTLEIIKNLAQKDCSIKFVSLSRNFGHQNALWAGLTYSKGDCVISLDADLQHPVELIPKMLEKWNEGYDVVYTIREDTEKTGFLKRLTSNLFYKFNNLISNVEVAAGAADFRLLDRKVVDALIALPENNLFIRGLVSWAGYRQISLTYIVKQRHSGVSKYSLKKMLKLASSGITSFSILPLQFPFYFSAGLFCLFIIGIFYVLLSLFLELPKVSWLLFMTIECFMYSILLFSLGIVGNYLGLLFLENKRRPNYLVKETNIQQK